MKQKCGFWGSILYTVTVEEGPRITQLATILDAAHPLLVSTLHLGYILVADCTPMRRPTVLFIDDNETIRDKIVPISARSNLWSTPD